MEKILLEGGFLFKFFAMDCVNIKEKTNKKRNNRFKNV